MTTPGYKNALLPLSSYPQPTLPAGIAAAIAVAASLDLRLVGLDMQVNPPTVSGFAGYAMPVVGTTVDTEEAKTKANADAIAQEFFDHAQKRGVSAELRRVACDSADGPAIAAAMARLFDLAILPIAPGARGQRDLAEAVVFGCGRPCLLLPHYWTPGPHLFGRPIIAWDASRAASRALADALPLLRRAGGAHLVVVAPEQSAAAQSTPDVARWLNDHGVRAECARIDETGLTAAEAIAKHADAVGADLIVMGAFGHSRMRDFILGGVTQSVLADPKLPVLFSH